MASLKRTESFGHVRIPISSEGKLTACYEAPKWADLAKAWRISMYLTEPATEKPVEMTSITLLVNVRDYSRAKIVEDRLDAAILSEPLLKKDWMRPEEDEAWRSL
ncbi:MAG: hypothetical protein WCE90_04170 [Candidatus Zixiibacteriota bacterium]